MEIDQIWVGNSGRNFNYLVGCQDTREALVIDPLDGRAVLERAMSLGWKIVKIINTHEHADHTMGNKEIVRETKAKVITHSLNIGRIESVDEVITEGQEITVGNTVRLQVLQTPGHTMSHICLFSNGEFPVLFSGDTIFNAGVGNCHHGGNSRILYETIKNIISLVPLDTKVFPGHEYFLRNLEFTINLDPTNIQALPFHEMVVGQNPAEAYVTTIREELQINTFFRLDEKTLIDSLRDRFPKLSKSPPKLEVFLYLRALRDSW